MEPLRRLVRRLSHQRWFLWLMSHVLPRVDRALHRVTGRRATVTQFVLPILMLRHTGRQTGRELETPLTYVRVDRGWAVAASSFGRGDHPDWSENLLENPQARVLIDGEEHDVVARLVDEDEHAELMPRFEELWPPYRTYQERVAQRGIRVFALEPRSDGIPHDIPGQLP